MRKPSLAQALQSEDALPLLRHMTHQELQVLVELLDRSFDVRIKSDPRIRRAMHNLTLVPARINDHLLRASGHALMNMFGRPTYRSELCWVADKLGCSYESADTVPAIEMKLLGKLAEDTWNKADAQQRADLIAELERKSGQRLDLKPAVPFAVLTAQIGARMTGFLVYQIAVQAANALAISTIGTGLAFGVNAALTRTLGAVLGPIGLAATTVWFAASLFGPSLKSAAPAVVFVATVRQQRARDYALGQ